MKIVIEDVPEGFARAQYDPINPSYHRTTGFTMSEALLPVFRAAVRQL